MGDLAELRCRSCWQRITRRTGYATMSGPGLDSGAVWCLDKNECTEDFCAMVGRNVQAHSARGDIRTTFTVTHKEH